MRRKVDNRYTVLRPLGAGGAGEVFLARDEVLGREVALKMLSGRHAGDPWFAERFRREARSAASLSHPNIVAVHDLGEFREDPGGAVTRYITMEYVPGITLRDLLRDRGALPVRAAARIAARAARGLEAAHRQSIVHRDVKPANILLSDTVAPDGLPAVVKVADFGIARVFSEGTLTEDSAMMGTAHYLSPEQAKGEPVGPASDLYSLGVVLYEMVAGRRPFEAAATDGPFAVAMKHATQTPAPPSRHNPALPTEIDALVMRLLGKDPDRRPAAAAVIAQDLERLANAAPAQGDPTPTANPDPPPRERRSARRRVRRPRVLPVVATLALLLAFVLGVRSFADGWSGEGGAPRTVPAALGAAEDYYLAVDREDWSYTYANLDSRSREGFTEREWRRKNQWYADTEGFELRTIDVGKKSRLSGNLVEVTVDRTFKNGDSLVRDTFFVHEDGSWKHRLSAEEGDIFMPDATYAEFVRAKGAAQP